MREPGPTEGSHEHDNESSGYIENVELLHCSLLKKDSATWSELFTSFLLSCLTEIT
jgi:hypothetical protein